MSRSKAYYVGLTLMFLFFVGGFFIASFLIPSKEFSDLENRRLQLFPDFSKEAFFDGEFGTELETYLADQFPFRNSWISMKSNVERAVGKTENKGVFVSADDYFIQDFKNPSHEVLHQNIDYIHEFAKKYPVTMMVAPTATKVLAQKLPPFAKPSDEGTFLFHLKGELNPDIQFVSLLEPLMAHKDEYIYYKTDHHWTTLGAYYAYLAYCETKGITPAQFSPKKVTDEFYGTMFSKGNFTYATPDDLYIYEPQKPNKLDVTYVAEGKNTDSLYDYDQLKKKDKYGVFLNGNHPYIKIKTSIKNGKKLLIVKDSYANALIPFLTEHYEEIHVLDLRFINAPITNFVEQEKLDEALLIYNVQNFSQERKFSLLK